jgi:hypothetical protein
LFTGILVSAITGLAQFKEGFVYLAVTGVIYPITGFSGRATLGVIPKKHSVHGIVGFGGFLDFIGVVHGYLEIMGARGCRVAFRGGLDR